MVDFGEQPSQQAHAIMTIINRATPLFLAGLAVSIAFRMGLFNIGVEGQYRLATIMAAAVGRLSAPGAAARPVHHRGRDAGRGGVGGHLRPQGHPGRQRGISSIMLNFVALGLASYFLTGPLRGSGAGASISDSTIPESGWFPCLNGLLGALGLAEPAAASTAS